MKTTLLVVGRTVEQHFITAINDYVQRTRRYLIVRYGSYPGTEEYEKPLRGRSERKRRAN